jgi:hypothetical protein
LLLELAPRNKYWKKIAPIPHTQQKRLKDALASSIVKKAPLLLADDIVDRCCLLEFSARGEIAK